MATKLSKLCVFLFFISIQVFAQTPELENVDFSKIKVEELSDSQISQIKQRAEENGMTEAQMKAALLTRGMPSSEVSKLEERLKTLGSEESSYDIINRNREQILLEEKDDVFESLFDETAAPSDIEIQTENRIFGYDLFRNPNLSFEPAMNIPTPPDYQLGPGDQLFIDVWGASQQNYQLQISPDGTIFIENLGPISVTGLTMEQASDRIIGRLKSIYSGLSDPGRNTYAEVTLGNARTISVHILGEVNLPGTFILSSFASVFNALYASGGPNINGSFRNIEVFRNNKRIASLDVYDFLMNGTQKDNIRLQDQDIIKVNPYRTKIDISGEVKRPGIYELSTEESLAELITYTGGFTDEAYSKLLTIYRKTDTEKKIIDLPKTEISEFNLQDGDSIPVAPILNRFENRVTINGAIYRPGEYSLNSGLTLKALVEKAEGLRDDAFLSRALIYRTREDFSLEVIPVNLKDLKSNPDSNVILFKDDVVSISSIFDLREEYYIEIHGEVNQPGVYPFMENASLEDLIILAGGLKESATKTRVEISRRLKLENDGISQEKISEILYYNLNEDLEILSNSKQFIVKPFDQIFVRKSPAYELAQQVTISGEVLFPGSYSLSTKNERISDIIARSGGLNDEAYPKGARLIRKVKINQKERKKALESLMRESGDSLVINIEDEAEQAIGIDLEKILANPGSKFDIFIQDQDQIVIPKEMQTVRLSGALLYPITVRYDKNYGFNKYISMSGGFANDAKRSKSYVIYANGSIDRTTNYLFFNNYPKVEPGAEIVVPQKPPKDNKMSASEAVGISSALSSMALIIVTIINSLNGS